MCDLPYIGSLDLGVVGYPGDLMSPGDPAYGEHMYEMYLPTNFDLATSDRLLQYQIDTFGGNSGSPVFVKDSMNAIGVHVLGGNLNSASVIGPLGNSFEIYKGSFLAKPDPTFDIATKIPSRVGSFRVVTVPSRNERDSKSNEMGRRTIEESLTDASTSVFDALRSLLDSTVRAPYDSDYFLGKLGYLLEPSMVSAMSDACNGAEGLVKALQFLWDVNKDSPANSEALLTTLVKHKSTAAKVGKAVIKHRGTILKTGEFIGERSPTGMVLRYGFDAASEIASSNNESLMDHIATGLSVTVPIMDKELPKLGSIGGPIATMAASALRSVGSQAAAAISPDSAPTSPSPESAPVQQGALPGANERAILAEVALHGVMHLDKSILRDHQVYDKMHVIIKPLAPTIQRADSMLSSIMQPAITKVALASLAAPSTTLDASQGSIDVSEQATDSTPGTPAEVNSPLANTESLTFENLNGTRLKIGVTVPSRNTSTTQPDSYNGTPIDERISAFTEALMTANPDLEDNISDMVSIGMQLDDDSFSNSIVFGLPLLLGDGQESDYEDENAESAVPVTGLAHRAMLAEAALQVMLQLPIDVIKSLEMPDLKPTIDAFQAENPQDQDEAEQSSNAPNITAAASVVSAVGSIASSIASSANAALAHKDKKKDQEQKERELQMKERDQQQAADSLRVSKIGQNMQAKKDGLQQPHKDVTRFHPVTGKAIEPGQHHPDDDDTPPPPGGPPGGASGTTGGGPHGATGHQPPPHISPHHSGGDERPNSERDTSEHEAPAEPSAKVLGKKPIQKPKVAPKPSHIATKLPSHPKPEVKPKPKVEAHKPKEEEEKPKAKEPSATAQHHPEEEHKPEVHEPKEHKPKVHEPEEHKPEEHPPTHQTAPVHAGATHAKAKEEEPKEEEKSKAPRFREPTASSAAKKTKPTVPPKPNIVAPKRGGVVKRGGKREALLTSDPESLIAEDFVSGFSDY